MPSLTLSPEAFASLELVAVVAFLAPLALDLLRLRFLPAVVLEIGAGMIIGPYGLGWVRSDAPIQIFSLIGLSFLLFLAGMEVHLSALRGPRPRGRSAGLKALPCPSGRRYRSCGASAWRPRDRARRTAREGPLNRRT